MQKYTPRTFLHLNQTNSSLQNKTAHSSYTLSTLVSTQQLHVEMLRKIIMRNTQKINKKKNTQPIEEEHTFIQHLYDKTAKN